MPSLFPSFRSLNTALGGLLLLLVLAGCLHERLTWSPDGQQAAVITLDGLHLTDAAGTLSPLLLPGVYRAAWCPDSTHLVVARKRELRTFQDLAAALGPDRTRAVVAQAEGLWRSWEVTTTGNLAAPEVKLDADGGALALYLREHHREKLYEKFPGRRKDIESLTAEWHTVQVVRAEKGTLEVGATLTEGLAAIDQILPSPGGYNVAWVAARELTPDNDDSRQVLVAPLTGTAPPVQVAGATAGFPDWTADGRTLLVLKSGSRAPGSDEPRLGTLTAHPVQDADGRFVVEMKGEDLAGLVFHDASRVRALRDGRVVFNAVELNLPFFSDERDLREEFFVADPKTRQVTRLLTKGTLVSLPQSLAHFEVSPDDAQILVSDDQGKVWLITVAEAKVEMICAGFGKGDSIAPAWRAPGDFTYRKPGNIRNDLIQRAGGQETVLSRGWPSEVLARLVESPEPGAK